MPGTAPCCHSLLHPPGGGRGCCTAGHGQAGSALAPREQPGALLLCLPPARGSALPLQTSGAPAPKGVHPALCTGCSLGQEGLGALLCSVVTVPWPYIGERAQAHTATPKMARGRPPGLCAGEPHRVAMQGSTGGSLHVTGEKLGVSQTGNPSLLSSLSLRRALGCCEDGRLLPRPGAGDAGERCPDPAVGAAARPAGAGDGRGRPPHLQ